VLFPRMQAVVHHGGAGTTGAVLRAGVPQVVVPFLADQAFWGSRVAAAGGGRTPIPSRMLTAGALEAAPREETGDGGPRKPPAAPRSWCRSSLIRRSGGRGWRRPVSARPRYRAECSRQERSKPLSGR